MFGWLAHRSACARARTQLASTRWLRFSPTVLAQALPSLGCVLYLPPPWPDTPDEEAPAGVLAERRELAPLLRTRTLYAASAVTADGPREWIECMDAAGRPQARLYLLPDTDYLAWDALLAAGELLAPVLAQRRVAADFRAASAELLCFTHRHLPWLTTLGRRVPESVSALSRGIAADIAHAEAVGLVRAAVE